MENSNLLESAKLEPLKMVNEQSRDYEKGAIELSKSYIGHIITISALFIGFLPQFIKSLDIKGYFLGIFSVGEIFFALVIIIMLIIYRISINHQEYNVESANKLYNSIANGNNANGITEQIQKIGQESAEKNIKVKYIVNTLSIISNTLFFLGILMVLTPMLIYLYK